MRWIGFLVLAFCAAGCDDPAAGPSDQKVVPNETPQQRMEPVKVREQASTVEILETIRKSEEARRLEAEARQREEQEPQDLGELEPEERVEAAEHFLEQATQRPRLPQALKPYPEPEERNGFQKSKPRERLKRVSKTETRKHPSQPPRPGGSRLFEPRPAPVVQEGLERLLPPGRFFRAQLVGNVTASVFSPVVFATITDPEGRRIGTAMGKAHLHSIEKDRVLLQFSKIYLEDKRVLNGNLAGFDLDLSQGLLGRVERRSFKRFALAVAETLLGALSLEVKTEGDSFGNAFKFNLANKLFDQARDRINEQELDRQVHLERDTVFWVSTTSDARLRTGTHQTLDAISIPARDAFKQTLRGQDYSSRRRAQLQQAYRKLQDKLNELPGPANFTGGRYVERE